MHRLKQVAHADRLAAEEALNVTVTPTPQKLIPFWQHPQGDVLPAKTCLRPCALRVERQQMPQNRLIVFQHCGVPPVSGGDCPIQRGMQFQQTRREFRRRRFDAFPRRLTALRLKRIVQVGERALVGSRGERGRVEPCVTFLVQLFRRRADRHDTRIAEILFAGDERKREGFKTTLAIIGWIVAYPMP